MKQQKQPILIKQKSGQLASSTGNITGIYDLSGGAFEITAGYITNGHANLENGSTVSGIPALVAKTTEDASAYMTLSTKYATIYPHASNDSRTNNYATYKNANYGYGDAILETSSTGDLNTSWFQDYSIYLELNSCFLSRGGRCVNEIRTGVFAFAPNSRRGYIIPFISYSVSSSVTTYIVP